MFLSTLVAYCIDPPQSPPLGIKRLMPFKMAMGDDEKGITCFWRQREHPYEP
jgi:hypothetical protein